MRGTQPARELGEALERSELVRAHVLGEEPQDGRQSGACPPLAAHVALAETYLACHGEAAQHAPGLSQDQQCMPRLLRYARSRSGRLSWSSV